MGSVVLCEICSSEPKLAAKYQCSRCLKRYCSLKCFKSPGHEDCSEKFFEKSVREQLQLRNPDDKDKVRLLKTINKYTDAGDGEGWKYECNVMNMRKLEDQLPIDREDLHASDEEDRPLTSEEESELAHLIENAPPELLLKSLSSDQKARFDKLLQQYEVVE